MKAHISATDIENRMLRSHPTRWIPSTDHSIIRCAVPSSSTRETTLTTDITHETDYARPAMVPQGRREIDLKSVQVALTDQPHRNNKPVSSYIPAVLREWPSVCSGYTYMSTDWGMFTGLHNAINCI